MANSNDAGKIATLVLLVAFGVPVLAGAHLGETIFPIYEIPTRDLPDLLDNSLEDWEAALPNLSLSTQDLVSTLGLTPDPGNLAVGVYLAWHNASQRIYIAIERIDDVFEPDLDNTAFLVDGDHSGGRFQNFTAGSEVERRRLQFAQVQMYFVRAGRPFGSMGQLWLNYPPNLSGGGFMDGPNYSAVEFAITPWDDVDPSGPELSTRSKLEPGRIIGFQIMLLDSDAPGQISGSFTLSPGTDFDTADLFVDGLLLSCEVADCSHATETAVRADSWGRIKAGFLRD